MNQKEQLKKIVEDLTLKFTSSNDTPVSRAVILREEWEIIKSFLEVQEGKEE